MTIGCDLRLVFGVVLVFLVGLGSSVQYSSISNVLPNATITYSNCMLHDLKNMRNHTFEPDGLIINHCYIPELPNALFVRLTNLTLLEITESKLTTIQDFALNGLPHLRSLNLMKNNISEIRSWTSADIKNLTNLDLRRNTIKAIVSKNFSRFPNLQKLNLAVNLIAEIPPNAFNYVTNLKYLNIGRNSLKSIGNFAFRGLAKLSQLALHHNAIEAIEKDAFITNGNLRSLRLEGNRLAEIDPALIQSIPRLGHLNLSHNALYGFEDGIFSKSAELKGLDLSYNRFKNVTQDIFIGLQVLEVLNFSSNSIRSIHSSSFTNLNHMIHFDMSSNNVTSLTAGTFEYFRQVDSLNLSGNALVEIDSHIFRQMQILRILDLSSNRLHTDNFLHFESNLQYLDLSRNFYRGLNLSSAYHLGRVDLIGNPWDCGWLIGEMVRAPDTIHFGSNYIIKSKGQMLDVLGIDCYDDMTQRSIILMEKTKCGETEQTTQVTHTAKLNPWLKLSGDTFDHKSVLLWLIVAVGIVFMAVQGGRTIMKKSEKKSEQLRQNNHERVMKELDEYFDTPHTKDYR